MYAHSSKLCTAIILKIVIKLAYCTQYATSIQNTNSIEDHLLFLVLHGA